MHVRCFISFQKIPEVALTEEMIADTLSLLCKTGDGLAHAYVRLDVHERYEIVITWEISRT